MTECRLLIDLPAPGAWNMAVDEVLLDWSAATHGCCWRFYRWSEPTLSLGYFQDYGDRRSHAASRHCTVVRRASGGGAILHDDELTYSVVVPLEHPLARNRRTLYEAVHATLIEVLEGLGVHAAICRRPAAQVRGRQPFLCFQRRYDGDVVVGDTKIAGSAQRRNQGAVLQHGSVLLGQASAAPELGGLDCLAPGCVSDRELVRLWMGSLAERLQFSWREEPLNPPEQERAAALVRSKYGSEEWVQWRGHARHWGTVESL